MLDKIKEKWQSLEPSMRTTIIFATSAFIVFLIVISYISLQQKINNEIKEIETLKKTIQYIEDNQQSYLINRDKKEAMRQRLLEADGKVSSLLTGMASNLGFDVTVTPKDPHKVSDNSGAEAQEIEVSIRNVDHNVFIQYLIEINALETPIFIRRIDINRTSANVGPETKLSVALTLVSFRLRDEE